MKSKNITIGGISVALSVVILYLTTIIPINTVALLTLASAIIPIVIIRSDFKTAILVYMSSSILSFFILPINYTILYTLIFGIYGLVKFFIEKINRIFIEILLKIAFFNIVLIICYILIKTLLVDLGLSLAPWLFFIIAQIGFLVYDYALTLIITLYLNKIHNKIK